MDSGRTHERIKEIINIFRTQLDKRSLSHSKFSTLKILTDSATSLAPNGTVAIVNPKPKHMLMEVIKMFLSDHPISEIDFMPITAMLPNKATIVPPITASGIVYKKLAIGGKKLAIIKRHAPVKIV